MSVFTKDFLLKLTMKTDNFFLSRKQTMKKIRKLFRL